MNALKSFKITWDRDMHMYRVSIPNYEGGEVVPLKCIAEPDAALVDITARHLATLMNIHWWQSLRPSAKRILEALAQEMGKP